MPAPPIGQFCHRMTITIVVVVVVVVKSRCDIISGAMRLRKSLANPNLTVIRHTTNTRVKDNWNITD